MEFIIRDHIRNFLFVNSHFCTKQYGFITTVLKLLKKLWMIGDHSSTMGTGQCCIH